MIFFYKILIYIILNDFFITLNLFLVFYITLNILFTILNDLLLYFDCKFQR